MSWETAEKAVEKSSNSGGLYVRLANDGDKVVGVFLGDPYTREVVWTGEAYEAYSPELHMNLRPSLKISLNFYVPADGQLKIIEGTTAWFKDVLKVRAKYGLDKWTFEIQRHGAPRDTKTSYTILPDERIDATLQSELDELILHDLREKA